MLEDLGLVVDLVPGHPERVGQIGLEQPVVADDLQRDLLARRAQRDPVVGLVLDQAHLGHPLQHRRNGPRRDAEALGQRRGADRAAASPGERVDRLRVVLDRLGVGDPAIAPDVRMRAGGHQTVTRSPVR